MKPVLGNWRRRYFYPLIIFLGVLPTLACSDTRPFMRERENARLRDPQERPDSHDIVTFYALGDWGTGRSEQKAVAAALQKEMANIRAGREIRPFVLEAGDNVYEDGLPEGWGNPQATKLLHGTFGEIYDDIKYEDQPVDFHIVPGNHDYSGVAGGKYGWGDVIHQETTAEKLYPNWYYYPIDPARNRDTNDSTDYAALRSADIHTLTLPEEIPVGSANVAIFAIDTQVLLDLYDMKNTAVLQQHWDRLDSLVAASPAKWKLIIGHHPIASHGTHGGFRPWYWYLPPIFIVTVIDKFFYKRIQDLDHPAARAMRHDLQEFMKRHGIDFYIAGHEHSLQFLALDKNVFQLISGSAGKQSQVSHKDDTLFSHQAFGFVRFDATESELWLQFFEVRPENTTYQQSALFQIVK